MQLFFESPVASDGSTFKVVNSGDRNYTRAKLKRCLEPIDEHIARHLGQLESADRERSAVGPSKREGLQQKIE